MNLSLSLSLSLSLQLFLRLSKQRSLLFRRMLRSVSWKLPARSDQRIVLQFLLFLPKHRGEEYKPSFQQHQRQRLRKLLLWRKPQNLKVTTILCQVRTHISCENWTAKFYNLVSDLILWYLIKDLISIWRIWSLMTLRWAASSTKAPPPSPWTSHPLWSTANISCLHLSLFSYRSIHLLVNMLPLYPFNHLFQRAHIPLHWNFFRVLMLEKLSWTLYCVVWWGL